MTSKEHVRKLRERNPAMPAADIARETGLTRQRVRQILISLGLPTRESGLLLRDYAPEIKHAQGLLMRAHAVLDGLLEKIK